MSIREKNLITMASLFYNPIFKSKSEIYNVVNQSHSQLAFPCPSQSVIQPLLKSVLPMETHLMSVLGPSWSSRTSGALSGPRQHKSCIVSLMFSHFKM